MNERGSYFKDEIIRRNWGFLLYNEGCFYIPDLVEEFYNGFQLHDYDEVRGRIRIVWRGVHRFVDINLISVITGIPLAIGSQTLLEWGVYFPLMGPACQQSDRGISGAGMFVNIYTACRWVAANVTSSSNITSFYKLTLHVVHALMIKNRYFCMCRQLISTIAKIKQPVHARDKLSLS